MAQVPLDDRAFDRSEYSKAERHFRAVEDALPEGDVQRLALEVVRRLAFRVPRGAHPDDLPTDAEIDRLCAALLSGDEQAADNFIFNVRQGGAPITVVYLGYMAGAARKLGEMWEADKVSFVDVTLACGKLYRIIRGLRHIIAPEILSERDEKPAMFALVPGETHTLGIEMATDIFRRNGWDIDMMIGLDHDMVVDQSERRKYNAIVLVANSDGMLEPLNRLVLALRISHPLAQLVVAGNIADQRPNIDDLVGADAVMNDIETAIATLQAVIDGSSAAQV